MFYGRHQDVVNRYGISASQMTTEMFRLSQSHRVFPSLTTYHRVCNKSNTTGDANRRGTAYPSRAHEVTPGF